MKKRKNDKCGLVQCRSSIRPCAVCVAFRTRMMRGRLALKHSLKCGIAGSVNFRKCRISARASQRARKREVSSGAHVYRRVFKKNSKLKAPRCLSGAFKHSLKCGIYFLIVNVPSFTKRDCPFIPSVTAFSLAPRGVPLIKSEPTVVVEPFSLLTSV